MHFYLIILQVFFNFHSAFSDSTQLLPNFPLSSPISVDTANNFIDTGIDFVLKTPAVPPQAKAVIAVGAALVPHFQTYVVATIKYYFNF